jgi:rhodanese-related sulfurtransferase
LEKEQNWKFKIKKSKTISTKKINTNNIEKKEASIINSSNFKKLIFDKNYTVLDIREDLEYKAWNIKNSIHIRLPDLKQLWYEKLNKKKTILVYDWNWQKAKEAANFLISKWYKAKFLEKWIKNLTINPKIFSWTKNFFQKYNKNNYKNIFDTKSLENILNLWWVFLVDVRKRQDFETKKIDWSINIPLVYLPKTKWDFYINKIPEKSKIITICDNPETCFYAQVVWIEMEKRLYKFLWIYKLK